MENVSTLQRLAAWDEAMLLRVVRYQRPRMTKLMRAMTHIGDGASLTFLALVLMFVGTQQTDRLAWLVAYSAGGAAFLAQVLKRVLKRRRPTSGIAGFNALVANPDAFSFPSGHTAASLALAVAWAGEGSGLGSLMGVVAVLVAMSRVYLGAHYPLDVAAGSLLGLVAGTFARWMV